ncbi:MAG: 2-amino-4-hydroxy-6-hydroxymethyldihydropteridine diphosphokinase [bacterium]|nr:2-amino-4-hydroxy-6-hydroxymethyldihydropteridine diphosphokinase [Candidatus Limimorpha caballi]
MASETVFILVGSNVGDRAVLLERACASVGCVCGRVVAKSPIYESEPWGFEAEQWFLNQVVEIETELPPDDLMLRLLDIERDLGRDRVTPHEGYASRTMDLDILYYGDEVVGTEHVTAPHPRLHLRRFTLLPLCDVAPDFVHPKLKKSNAELLESCEDRGIVNKL